MGVVRLQDREQSADPVIGLSGCQRLYIPLEQRFHLRASPTNKAVVFQVFEGIVQPEGGRLHFDLPDQVINHIEHALDMSSNQVPTRHSTADTFSILTDVTILCSIPFLLHRLMDGARHSRIASTRANRERPSWFSWLGRSKAAQNDNRQPTLLGLWFRRCSREGSDVLGA